MYVDKVCRIIFSSPRIFFFLMLLPPPRSTLTYTLFPYTTLFRSRRASARSKFYPRRIVPPGVHAMPVLSRLSLPLALSLLLASGTVAAAPDGADIDKVNGSITAESGQVYGDLDTVNGSIRLEDGAHARDAQTVNGSVKAGDDIEAEDLGTVNGDIRVGERARISGGIETVNGGIFVGRGGNVAKGIETVNGAIGIVATELGGGIETGTGDITVGTASHVRRGRQAHKHKQPGLRIRLGSHHTPHNNT